MKDDEGYTFLQKAGIVNLQVHLVTRRVMDMSFANQALAVKYIAEKVRR